MSDHKFQAGNKHHFGYVGGARLMGGMNEAEDRELVMCDRDAQPHYKNSHVSETGRALECYNPLPWSTKGVKMKEMDL